MKQKLARKLITVEGIVQGVGFRPFVYNLACRYKLKGRVSNTLQGVEIEIEGTRRQLAAFISDFKVELPPLAEIEKMTLEDKDPQHYDSFKIQASKEENQTLTFIAPDAALCDHCKEELQTPQNRRYSYPFINCTNCGPRFSIINDLPYDRPATTMDPFVMCSRCRNEYEDPTDRRFHAQPNACPDCGPTVWLANSQEQRIEVDEPFNQAGNLLADGKILAVKGLGGFHLICAAEQKETVQKLRARKQRPAKPLAVMIKDIQTVHKYCRITKQEAEVLQGKRAPIVLLAAKNNLPANIAPDTDRLGVMLPYTPLHQLLFTGDQEVLVVTSGNQNGLPIEYQNQGAQKRLAQLADYWLLHDREIAAPLDDSVVEVDLGQPRVVRRSRGYVPRPVKVNTSQQILACGADFKNTICLSKGQFGFVSQHNGNLQTREAQQRFRQNISHLQQIYDFQPQIIVHDLHPEYYTTRFAQARRGKKIAVQHHHAHLVSCMVERNIKGPVIGLAFDGTGFGTDGRIWGGEFLVCDNDDFQRAGQFNYVKMPGGSQAVAEPWRMAVSYLYQWADRELDWNWLLNLSKAQVQPIIKMLDQDFNCPQTSSLGRLFAGVSALLNLVKERTYRPQAAVKLETAALRCAIDSEYSCQISCQANKYIVNTDYLIEEIVEDIIKEVPIKFIARKFHNTIIEAAVKLTKLIREDYDLSKVVLSGGVLQNKIIRSGIYNQLLAADFQVYLPQEIPCNDGGLALGQLAVAGSV